VRRFVVDASVAIKWFVPEVHHEAARRLLREGFELLSPDLIRPEVGNVLWKKWRRGELSAGEAVAILRDFGRFPLRIRSSESLMEGAWTVAQRFGRSFYDGLYVALAVETESSLVTADLRLYNALCDDALADALADNLLWVEEAP
jgi:predicted nucleic acid-binding protein